MIITNKIEHYLDTNAHRECMRRTMFMQYSRAEIDGDYVYAMYSQLCLMSAEDHCAEILQSMTIEEHVATFEWMYL